MEEFCGQLEEAIARLAKAQPRPEVRARLKELGIPLLFSYGRFA